MGQGGAGGGGGDAFNGGGGGGGAGYFGGGGGGGGSSFATMFESGWEPGGGGGGGSSYAPGGRIGADTTGTPSATISYTVATTALATTLASDSTDVGPGNALFEKASAIQTAINAGDTGTACAGVSDFVGLVNAQTGKKLNSTHASQLTTDADNLAAALGCA